MCRLTLDEAIAHCKEKSDCSECGKEHKQLAVWLAELQRYKNLKEQGRLIELPCAVGDTVYVINKHCPSPWKKEYCDDARNILPKDPCSVCPHRTAYIAPGKYNLKYLTRESEIFYTKEAAESKLAEMEGAE